ncbi:MAG: sensor histidine kinase [Nocardioidaceae bacterium]
MTNPTGAARSVDTPFLDLIDNWSKRDPRGPQLVFAVPYLLITLALFPADPQMVAQGPYLASIALVVVLTIAALTVPWDRISRHWLLVVVLLDLAAVGATRSVTPSTLGITFLVMLPALWFGLTYRWLGVALAAVSTAALVTLPVTLREMDSVQLAWARLAVIPFVAAAVATAMCLNAITWSRQKRSLVRQRELLDAVLHTVDVGILTLDADRNYVLTNRKQVEFNRLVYAVPPERPGEEGAVFDRDRTTPIPHELRASVRAAHGEEFSDFVMWVGATPSEQRALSASARPIYNSRKQFDGAVLVYQDVTDLISALSVKDEFVAAVSHELRTPLTSILGYIELIEDYADELPDVVNRHLTVVTRNSERLLALVSDLLTTAQVEAGRLRLSLTPAGIGELTQRSLDSAAPRASERGIEIAAELRPVPTIEIDVGRITQVLDNLLSNAIKYTPAGGTITVCLRPADGGRATDAIVLSVADTGMGISEKDQAGLFTKFFRSTDVERQAIPGAGLGLVITKEIVEVHGGTIRLESERGVGTTVTVWLPSSPHTAA